MYLDSTSIYSITGFHSCTIGKGGYDLAHFLLTSTTREFRTQNLELVLKAYLSELDDVIGSQGNISLVTNRAYHLMILVFEEFNYSNIIEIRIQARHISYGRAQSRL